MIKELRAFFRSGEVQRRIIGFDLAPAGDLDVEAAKRHDLLFELFEHDKVLVEDPSRPLQSRRAIPATEQERPIFAEGNTR